jgi:hypothetical protein
MTQQVAVEGRHDFDVIFGEWRILNRKLEDPLADSSEWLEFEATVEVRPILGGLGNVDLYSAPDFPGRSGYEGFGLRLFDPETGPLADLVGVDDWTRHARRAGRRPLPGRRGRFECDDTLGGRDVKVRFDWTDITPSSARWEQSFSFDGGESFEPNWIMELTR